MNTYFNDALQQLNTLFQHHGEALKIDSSWHSAANEAQQSFQFDDTGFTAMYMLNTLYASLICDKGFVNIGYCMQQPKQLTALLERLTQIGSIIQESGFSQTLGNILDAISKHFPDNSHLDKTETIADIYLKSLSGYHNFDKFQFCTGKDFIVPGELNLMSHVYLWRDYNSMLAHKHQLHDGVYMCFIESVFGFLVKNGSNLFAVMDKPSGNSDVRFRPDHHIETEPNFYLPYKFLNKWEQNKGANIALFNTDRRKELPDLEHQYAPEILCTIDELPFNSQVYLVVMYELLVSRYTELNQDLKKVETGSEILFGALLPTSTLNQFITVDEIKSENYLKRFPGIKYLGLNSDLEDLFADQIDWRILNLIKHNGKLYAPDETGNYLPFVNNFKYDKPHGVTVLYEPKFSGFDLTFVGTKEELEACRYSAARNNYAEALNGLKYNFMTKEAQKVRELIYESVNNNIQSILPLFAYENITVPCALDHGKTRRDLLHSRITYSNDGNFRYLTNQRIRFSKTKGNSSVEKCFITGTTKYMEIKVSFQSPDEISRFTGIPVSQLPKSLQLYRLDDHSNHYLEDSLDKVNMLWNSLSIDLFFVISKTTLNQAAKVRSTSLLVDMDIDVTEW